MTSQIICDVTDAHYDAKKTNQLEFIVFEPSISRLHGKRGKLNYNLFFSEATHNFLDHPSNQEVSLRSQTELHNVSNVRSTTRNCKTSYSAPRASERGSMRTAAISFT